MRYGLSDFGDNVTVTLSLYLNKQQQKLTTLAQSWMSDVCEGLQIVNGDDVIGPIFEYL